MPLNSNLAIAQEAARPKTRLAGTAIAATSRVSLMAAARRGSVMRGEIGAEPCAERLDEDAGQRQEQKQHEEDHGDHDQNDADRAALGGDGAGRLARNQEWSRRRQSRPNLLRLQA